MPYRRRMMSRAYRRKPTVKKAVAKAKKQVYDARVKAVVKKVLGRQIEVKSSQTDYFAAPVAQVTPGSTPATAFVNANVFLMSPNNDFANIAQGVEQDQRIGNTIRTKRCVVRAIITPRPYSATNNTNPKPTVVTFWCVSPKDGGYLGTSTMSSYFQSQFFQNNAQSEGYTSTLTDVIGLVNRDILTVHWKRSYKIGHSTMYSSPNATGGTTVTDSNNNAQWSNNDYALNRILKFDLTKHLSKIYKYNDTAQIPQGRAVYLICGIANADGSGYVSYTSQIPINLTFQHVYDYTDA